MKTRMGVYSNTICSTRKAPSDSCVASPSILTLEERASDAPGEQHGKGEGKREGDVESR